MTFVADPAPMADAAAELRRAASVVRVAVGPGAPIVSFIADGREWCASGAWQDRAPASHACALPTFVAGAPGASFPDGGLLAAVEPTVDVEADGSAGTITAWWAPTPYPLGWTRVVTLDADGALCIRYAVTNAQNARLPFVWGMPLRLPWRPSLTIHIPRGARSRVSSAVGEGLPPAGGEFAWPTLRDGGRLADLTQPVRLAPRRAVQCFVELPRGRFVIRDSDAALEVTGTAGVVTHASVWINHDAGDRTGVSKRWWHRHEQECGVAVGAAVGAPGSLADAVGGWRSARWVEPGETLRWEMRYRPIQPAL